MSRGGRPTVARSRVATYWNKHGPVPVRQVCRVLGTERSWTKRTLKLLAERGDIVLPPSHA